MKYVIVIAALAGLFAAGIAAASEVTTSSTSSALERANAIGAPIRSKDQLYAYLSVMPDSPLHKLGPAKMQSFIDSLVFTQRGLGSYSYIELEDMSSSDIYRILALFGSQADVPLIRRSVTESDGDVEQLLKSRRPVDRHNWSCIVRPGGHGGRCRRDMGYVCGGGCGND